MQFHGISTYAVFKQEYAIGTGRFIKPAENQRYTSDRQRQAIIDKNRRYLDKHRHKLKVFELYEHPGNTRILRWPALPDQAHSLRLWLCYQPHARDQVRCNQDGCRTISKFYPAGDEDRRSLLFERLVSLASCEIDMQRLWQARIYEQPTNDQVFLWTYNSGELLPGWALDQVATQAQVEDLLREIEHI